VGTEQACPIASDTWTSPADVSAAIIGEAAPGISGVVLASFNAG